MTSAYCNNTSTNVIVILELELNFLSQQLNLSCAFLMSEKMPGAALFSYMIEKCWLYEYHMGRRWQCY